MSTPALCRIHVSLIEIPSQDQKSFDIEYAHSSNMKADQVRSLFQGQSFLFYRLFISQRNVSQLVLEAEPEDFTEANVQKLFGIFQRYISSKMELNLGSLSADTRISAKLYQSKQIKTYLTASDSH